MAKQKQNKPTPTQPTQSENPKTKDGGVKDLRISVNEFGEIVRDYNIDDINAFLNENVPDKKFVE